MTRQIKQKKKRYKFKWRREELRQVIFSMMDAIDDPNMADGAMQAMHMNQVDFVNDQHGTDFDPHEMWLEWLQRDTQGDSP